MRTRDAQEEAEHAAMLKDAARYDWLRRHWAALQISMHYDYPTNKRTVEELSLFGDWRKMQAEFDPASLDRAVDVAMELEIP